MSIYTIQKIPAEDRPRERLQRHGPDMLSSAELIAILLGSGIKGIPVMQLANNVITHFGSLEKLAEATLQELCEVKGLGIIKAIQLKAAFSLGLRASRQILKPKLRIKTPIHAYNLLKDELERETRELFVVILQDIKGQVISHEVVAIGTLTQTLVHPREVFYPAIRKKASSIIIAHNHPSGDPEPSKEDYLVTDRLIESGKMIGISVLDHIIFGRGRYISLRQQGVSFE